MIRKKSNDGDSSSCSSGAQSEGNSQGEGSFYEIDIIKFDRQRSTNREVPFYKNKKKWKTKHKKSQITFESKAENETENSDNAAFPLNPLTESYYPVLETDPESGSATNEISRHITTAEELDEKISSCLEAKGSKNAFKIQLAKLIIDILFEASDDKLKKLMRNLRNLECDCTTLNYHEHNHNYYIAPPKTRKRKRFLKILRTPAKKRTVKTKEKKTQEKEELTVNDANANEESETESLNHSKVESSESGNDLPEGQGSSLSYLQKNETDYSSDERSELIATHSFSKLDFSSSEVEQSNAVQELNEKKLVKPSLEKLPLIKPKAFSKPEYTEIMESLKVLDKYLEPKVLTKAKTRISYIKCQKEPEEKFQVANEEHRKLDRTATKVILPKQNTPEASVNAANSDETRQRSSCSTFKKNNKAAPWRSIPYRPLAEYVKRELRDIKNKLQKMEKENSEKISNPVTVKMRGNNLKQRITPNSGLFVYSSQTYIVKGGNRNLRR